MQNPTRDHYDADFDVDMDTEGYDEIDAEIDDALHGEDDAEPWDNDDPDDWRG